MTSASSNQRSRARSRTGYHTDWRVRRCSASCWAVASSFKTRRRLEATVRWRERRDRATASPLGSADTAGARRGCADRVTLPPRLRGYNAVDRSDPGPADDPCVCKDRDESSSFSVPWVDEDWLSWEPGPGLASRSRCRRLGVGVRYMASQSTSATSVGVRSRGTAADTIVRVSATRSRPRPPYPGNCVPG
jgi:hypothetical protein